MSISRFIVNKPRTILVSLGLLITLGMVMVRDIPLDLYPEMEFPIVVVSTEYSGAGPEEVEKKVTSTIESVLVNVSNVKEITSTSSEEQSLIIVEFTWGIDLAEAGNEVRDRLELVKSYLPDEASTPQIFKFDPSLMPIMKLAVKGNRAPEDLRQIADDTILARIEQIEGVASAGISGGLEKEVRVEVSQNRLEAYELTLSSITYSLHEQNVQLSGGSINEGQKKYLLRTAGEYQSIDEIKQTVIAYKGSSSSMESHLDPAKIIRLQDVANVFEGYGEKESAVYINGEPGVYISIMKRSGANTVNTSNNVLKSLDSINSFLPGDIEVSVINDTTTIIRSTLSQVVQSAIIGAILAMVVLFLFLRNIKITLIIGLAIPISLLFTLMAMFIFNITLNLMTLTGLILGLGMLVDSSIVILENIVSYRERGAKHIPASVLGSQEMMTPILASTLTTICVFLPILVFRDILDYVGVFFIDMAFTVIFSLVASYLVAITVIPVCTSHYLKIYPRKRTHGKFFLLVEAWYKKLLTLALRKKALTIITIVGLFISTLFLTKFVGMEFMPSGKEDAVYLDVELPLGSNFEATNEVMQQLRLLAEQSITTYKDIIVSVGESDFFGVGSTSKGTLTITLPDFSERVEDSDDVKRLLRGYFDRFPGVDFTFTSGDQGGGGGSATPISLEIRTEDIDKMKEVAGQVLELLREVPGVTEPSLSFQDGLPEINVVVDRDRAYELGISMQTIGNEISAAVDGKVATKYRKDGKEYDVRVIFKKSDRSDILDLEKIFVINSSGVRIPVSNFASLEKKEGPVSISRKDQARYTTVEGGLERGYALDQVEAEIRKLLDQRIVVDDSVLILFGGDFEELQKYFGKFLLIITISILLVFTVMASQFESLKDPFIIFFSIPLMLIGVILIYTVTPYSFSLFTAVGLVVLTGIVVNNGIVLVDYTNLLIAREHELTEACITAGVSRLRPILMTSLTTILAMIPMAFSKGEGSELVQPIGLTVVGGMTSSTLITLILTPVVFHIFNSKRYSQKRKEKKPKRERKGKRSEKRGEKRKAEFTKPSKN